MNNQNNSPLGLSHFAFYVRDLAISSNFYVNFLGFEIVDRPNFSFEGLWLRNASGLEIHLIVGRDEDCAQMSGSRKNHVALRVHEVEPWSERAHNLGWETVGPKKRPDGIDQLFVKDPDGYWLELTNG